MIDSDYLRLSKPDYDACDNISFDYAVMEKISQATVLPVFFGWEDVGSWQSLFDIGVKDLNSNVCVGQVFAEDTDNSYLHTEDPPVAVLGLDNVVVVATDKGVLVTDKNCSQETKNIVEQMQKELFINKKPA